VQDEHGVQVGCNGCAGRRECRVAGQHALRLLPTAEQVKAVLQAWVKPVLLQVILWSYPYVRDGDF
jgi:hypothetical protein